MIKLRKYQTDAIEAIRDTFCRVNTQFIEMPTGSGKTVTFLSYAKQYHKKVLIIVPSKELLRQVYETALLFYDKDQISRKGDKHNDKTFKDLHICIVNSIRGPYADYLGLFQCDLLIIDEAHHIQAKTYRKFIQRRSSQNAYRILGVTATPDRADGQLIQELLHAKSYCVTTGELIKEGYLSDIEGFTVRTNIDLDDIDDHNGDFSLNQLYKKLCNESRDGMIVDVCKNMSDRKTLIFCINIAHSKSLVKRLNNQGLSAEHIDGSMDNIKRQSILTAFRSGEISYLCNCQLLTEGFDEPSIDGIVLARPTRSKALFNQMVGRGLRIFRGKKNCKVVDIADNHRNLEGFNWLASDHKLPRKESFKNFAELQEHVGNQLLYISEFRLERVNLLNGLPYYSLEALPDMINELKKEKIYFQEPLSIDEASFLLWHNKLKLEFQHG